MAVVIETTLGDITVDLFLEQRPISCLNFLKLCKMKYYNFNLFHSIRSGFIAQTGDPSGEGSGGESIWGILEGPKKRFFSGEKMPKIRHTDAGLLSMVCTDDMMIGSQFFFTLAPDLNSLDGQHCVIGEVTEGHDVLRKLNEVICDESHRPYRDVRITHTVILEDPFNDPAGLRAPSRSPSPSAERLKGGRIAPDEEVDETQGKSIAEVQEIIEEKEAKARATILEIIGDLPDADIAPPENVLFVCKLNPVTSDEDLEIIFSRFGKIVSCEVIRDKKTGDSLQYAFVEFSDKKSCEDAYFKMDNVLIDDRRIHVDFSQSVSKMKWLGKGRGVKHFTDEEIKQQNNLKNKRGHSKEKDFKKQGDQHSREKQDNRRHRHYGRERQNDKDQRHVERERHNNREQRQIDKERQNEKEHRHRDKQNERERKNRDEDRKDRDRSRTEDTKDGRDKMDKNKETSRNTQRDSDDEELPHNYNKNKWKESSNSKNSSKDDLKTYSKDKTRRSADRLGRERNDSQRQNRYSENENSKLDDYRKPRKENHRKENRNDSNDIKKSRNDSYSDIDREVLEVKEKNNKMKVDRFEFNAPSKHRSERSNDRKSGHKSRGGEGKKENREGNVTNKSSDDKLVEPKTPSPSPIKTIKDKTKKKRTVNKKIKDKSDKKSKLKRKRRRSSTTSSDTDSSDSSSSTSSSSSSSESDRRKRSKKKRKYSTSSTSSSSSDSTSSTSSSTDSSSSDSEPKKKRSKKNTHKKKPKSTKNNE